MSLRGSLFCVPLCALLISCTVQQGADTAQSDNENKSRSAAAGSGVEQFVDSRLFGQLKIEQGIEKPFAWEPWGGKEDGGTVVGFDHKGMLKRVEFVRTRDGYVVRPSEYPHKLNVSISKSGDLQLAKYLPDTEFPFKSFVVSADGCNVHFVLLWRAFNRSFQKRSVFLDVIDLRIIVEKDGTMVSNKLEELLFDSLDRTLAEDVNKDGRPDFLVTGSNMSTFVRIWTVEDCAVSPLLFKEGDHSLPSVGDKGLSLSKNKVSGAYDITVTHYEPITKEGRGYFEVTETVYRWDRTELVYKVEKTNSRLESG